jgi:hypothetical protein
MKDIGGVILGVLALVLVVVSAWAHFNAPCSTYKYSAVKDVPARCLMHK